MLSTTNTAPVLHHTNEFSVPKAIRSASSPSGSFPTVQHARVASLDINSGPASGSASVSIPASASASASASGSRTHSLSTSPSVSQLYPRSSILINSRKRRYSGVIYADPTVVAGCSTPAAPVVTHIPAVPSRKEREKERERAREREKEREREREKAKSKDDEKIWGIPKKALLLGLGDLNFNAQMAMMAGWGHGSGGASILPSTAIPTTTNDRKRLRPSASAELPRSSSSSSRRPARHSDSEDSDDGMGDKRKSSSRHASRCASDGGAHDSRNKSDGAVSPSPTEEPMDPEELAALNAIINTRRSMAAAQALVSGSLSLGPRALRASTSFGSSAQDLSRPPLQEKRFESQDSVPSMSSIGNSSLSIGSSSQPPTATSEKALQIPTTTNASSSASDATTTIDAAESRSARIRFAPLPTPTSAPAMLGRGSDSLNGDALLEDSDESDITDSDYDSEDEAKSMKGKWYLMGMPSAYFKPQYYTGKSSKRRLSKSSAAADGGGGDDRSEDGNSSLRRKSTGSLSDGATGHDTTRRTASENDEEERGRGGASGSKVKRKSSQSRRRSRSRTGAISSGDEDERARRRELIRLARPGGTGMVTLPDGTKIRARRVNDQPNQEEPEFIEWGFAGLAREASRRSLGGGSGPPSLATTPNGSDHKGLSAYMAAEEEEEDDGSGMAWVRRRRREREAKARMEREQAEKAAAEAAQGGRATQELASSEPIVQDPAAHTSATNGSSTATSAPEAAATTATTTTSVSTKTFGDSDVSMAKDVAPSAAVDEPMPLASSSDVKAQPETVVASPGKAKRQSLLSTIDTSRPVSGMFAEDAGAFVASPTAEEPPSASLDASMMSETSNGEPASLGGSQILSKPGRAGATEPSGVPGDSTPRQNTGLGLTADKAEEIRRRHEDEVAALGAEVLAQTRRNNQRRQASSSSRGVATPLLGGEETAEHQSSPGKSSSSTNNHRANQAHATSPTTLSSSTMHAETSRESGNSGNSGKKSISRAVGSIMRKTTTDSEKTVRTPGPTSLKQEVVFPQMAEPAEGKHSEEVSPTTTAAAAASSSSSHKQRRDASSARSPSPESLLSRHSSAVDGCTASAASKSASSLHTVGSHQAASSPMSAKRMLLDPSVSTPAPSPWLPRRPDARGVAVVPLPQLGVRPERPREGRVWQFDDSDASDAGKDDLMRERRAEEEEEEEEGSDLDAEELLEEERKTAMQKKRATTRAAGQEVVHARLGKKASARALSDLTASYDDMAIAGGSSSALRQRGDRKSRRRSMDPRMPSAPRKAPPKLVRSRRSLQSMQAGEGGEGGEEDEEQDLWPAVSATSKSGTPRPRHILVNLPGGPGIWDSKTGGGRNAVAAINSVAAARAKAIKKRAKDRLDSLELPEDYDSDQINWGWPRSLKGSLY